MVAMRLMHVGRDCHAVGEATAPAVRAGDGLVMISGSGKTQTSIRQVRTALAERATVVAVTSAMDSELAQLATLTLHIPVESSRQLGGTLFEHTALVVMDSVISALAAGLPDANGVFRYRHTNLE